MPCSAAGSFVTRNQNGDPTVNLDEQIQQLKESKDATFASLMEIKAKRDSETLTAEDFTELLRLKQELAQTEKEISETEAKIEALSSLDTLEREKAETDETEVAETEASTETEEVTEETTETEAKEVAKDSAEKTEEAPAEEAPVDDVKDEAAEEVAEETVSEVADETVSKEDDSTKEAASDETETEEAVSDDSETQTETANEAADNGEAMSNGKLSVPGHLDPGAGAESVGNVIEVTASSGQYGREIGSPINDFEALASDVLEAWTKHGGRSGWNVPKGGDEKFSIASFNTRPTSEVLGRDAENNYSMVREAVADLDKFHEQFDPEREEGLVASGGICAPFQQDYRFFRLATAQNPVERCLPTMRAPRGGTRFLLPVDYRDSLPGIQVQTAADDAAGYESTPENCGGPGPTPDKPCVCVQCPEIAECCVSAISSCVRWGNFNYYTFPELVSEFMTNLAINFAAVKEQMYLDAIDDASTPATSGKSYGASRDIIWDLRAAAVAYRRRHHMPRNAPLDILLPEWAIDIIKQDMVNSEHGLMNSMCVSDADVIRAIRCLNLRPCWYYDGPSSIYNDEIGDMSQPQTPEGPLNAFPSKLVSYMFSPGTFVRLDSGNLDMGLVRDSTLNKTNDLTLFMEEFTSVCFVGVESVRIEHCVCPDGSSGGPIDSVCDHDGTQTIAEA